MGESVEPKKKRLTMLKALLLLSLGPMLVVAIVLTLFGWMELSTALEEDVYHELIVAAENLKSHYEIQMAETQDHQPVYDHTYIDGIKDNDTCLIIGLGNPKSTPDSLGPKVIDNILSIY